VATLPIRKLGAAAKIVGGLGQVVLTDNPRQGLGNILEGTGTAVGIVTMGVLFSSIADGFSECGNV